MKLVTVVGSGGSGLTTALMLAAAGSTVGIVTMAPLLRQHPWSPPRSWGCAAEVIRLVGELSAV